MVLTQKSTSFLKSRYMYTDRLNESLSIKFSFAFVFIICSVHFPFPQNKINIFRQSENNIYVNTNKILVGFLTVGGEFSFFFFFLNFQTMKDMY